MDSQPGVGGTLTNVTNLGDPYSPEEARINRIQHRLKSQIIGAIMSAADDAVKKSTAQLNKAAGEIDAEVAKLKEQGVSDESLAGLAAISQSLDDRNADAPSGEEPSGEQPSNTEEPNAEPQTGGNPDGVTDTSE